MALVRLASFAYQTLPAGTVSQRRERDHLVDNLRKQV